MDNMTFVLVHGAWHGGWCWRRVADRLTAHGHKVFTPTLTGLADRSHLLSESVNLTTHINDVANLIRWEELNDVVLCGHSYGGFVITGAADKVSERIASLVYLDAFVPESGQSMSDLRPVNLPSTATTMPALTADYFNVNERDRAWIDRQMTPQPIGSVREKLVVTGAYRAVRRKTYIRAAKQPSPHFQAAYERVKADPGWIAQELPCGHDVMIDMPDALTELLEAAL